ncbi:MAG: 50S ribosomal protein L11 methyltransferase [Deinococcota bacterium]
MIVLRLPGTIDDDQLTASLWQAGCSGIVEDGDDLIAYFDADEGAPPELPTSLSAGQWEAMDTTDYVAKYNSDMQPLRIRKLVIAPKHIKQAQTELAPDTQLDDIQVVDANWDTDADVVIWLDPGLAFGSGHHITTQLALEMLEQLSPPPAQTHLLDVGTGSGILAIAAARLGFCAHGIDIDPQTVPVAQDNAIDNLNQDNLTQDNLNQDNLTQNHLTPHVTMPSFAHATLDDPLPQASYDVVIANIYAHVHADLMPAYAQVTTPRGLLVLTGIYQAEGLELVHASLDPWFSLLACVQVGDWSLVTALRDGN